MSLFSLVLLEGMNEPKFTLHISTQPILLTCLYLNYQLLIVGTFLKCGNPKFSVLCDSEPSQHEYNVCFRNKNSQSLHMA